MGAGSSPASNSARGRNSGVKPRSAPPADGERVLWLNCRGHTTAALQSHFQNQLDHLENPGSLVLVLEQLDRLEDSVAACIFGLCSIADGRGAPLTLIDPSGLAATLARAVWKGPGRESAAFPALPGGARRILFVERPESGLEPLRRILDLHGWATQAVQTAGDARQALRQDRRDAIVLDLDLPCAHSLGVAHVVREDHPAVPMMGFTSMEDVWNHDVSVRYGFRRILGKPLLIREMLEALRLTAAGA